MRDLTGKQFYHYRLIELLGEGAFGEVYLGEHIDQRAPVAVKILKIQLTKDTLKEFLNEARTFRLKHPHIVQLSDFGIEDDIPFLVMDYAPNGTLRQRHPRGSRLPLETIVTYVKQVSDALQYAHDMKIVHRDVKPQNILLGKNNELLLSDFGIAVIAHRESSIITQNTAGTLPYMAPEQLQRKSQPASDQYALGVIVYEWLCGALPFQGSEAEIIHQHLYVSPPSLKEKIPAIHPSVEMVVQKALAKEPGNRFSCIKDFADAFEAASKQTGQLQHIPPPSVQPSNIRSSTPAQKPPLPPRQPSVPESNKEMDNKPGISTPAPPPVVALNPKPVLQHQPATPSNNVPAQPSPDVVELVKSPGAVDSTAAANPGRPGIIELPMRRRVTVKLSPSDLAAANQSPVSPGKAKVAGRSTRPPNSGKMAAAAMLGAGAANIVAGPPPQRLGGWNFQPSPGMGGRGGPRRRSKRHRRYLLLLALLLLLTVLVTMSVIMAFNPKMVASMLPGASGAIVTITPDSKLISNSYVIQGVSGTADPAQRQVAVRQLTATAKSDPKTVNATGHTQTPGTVARGQLTFFNSSFVNSYTVGTNLPIPVGNVSLFLDVPAVIPPASLSTGAAGTITVSAHAADPGSAGNVSAHAADQICCNATGNVAVKNLNSFNGGQDAQGYHFVQQSDVDGVANPLENTVSAQAQASLKAQFRPGEQQVEQSNGANPCPSKVTTDNPIGVQGTNFNTVTVTVTATCSTLVYDHNALQTMITTLLASKANTDIGASYKLVGQIVMHITIQNIDQGNVSLLVGAKGVWVAQISDAQKTEIARAIAGKSVAQAQNILGARQDIGHIDIQASWNVLPGNPNQITIVIHNVPGAQDTATPVSGGPGSSTPVNSPGGLQTPQPGKG